MGRDRSLGTYTIRVTVGTGLAQTTTRETTITLVSDGEVRTDRPTGAPEVPLEPAQGSGNTLYLPLLLQ